MWYKFVIASVLLFALGINFADGLPISVFPIDNYPQQLSFWLAPDKTNSGSDIVLIKSNIQIQRFDDFKSRYFGLGVNDQSPWSATFISNVLKGYHDSNIYKYESTQLANYDNAMQHESAIGYGINFLPYDNNWHNDLTQEVRLAQFKVLKYSVFNRAIAVANLEVFSVPTQDPWYLSYNIAGEGFPFNENQVSNVYLGTPLYIIGISLDKKWSLIVTPHIMGWVRSTGIAKVSDEFIRGWNKFANYSLAAIITPDTSLVTHKGEILGSAFAGTVLPVRHQVESGFYVFMPLRSTDGAAFMTKVFVHNDNAVKMPLLATKHNISLLINKLMGRTYGWGGYLGYNDCSAEMQAIFTALGFYMPRNSAAQVKVGQIVDLTGYNAKGRMDYLLKNGVPFVTLIQIPGHIMLYVGSTNFNQQLVPVVYQNIWGMRKESENSRYIIGKSVVFPLLLSYPESPAFISLFRKKTFKLSIMNSIAPDYTILGGLY